MDPGTLRIGMTRRLVVAGLTVGSDGEVVVQAPFSGREESLVTIDIALGKGPPPTGA